MKALVLCGGIPQIALLNELKSRNIETVLADANPDVAGRMYADRFFPVSVLDIDAVRQLAVEEKVDMILTACADQVLLVQAQVSEELGLPCYIDYQTAKDVSSKELMKKVFVENDVPTSRFVIMSKFVEDRIKGLSFPLIVKPVDSYSSRGVRKVQTIEALKQAFDDAVEISRTNTAIIEEYIEGDELTVDVYVEDGQPHVLCISNINKISGNDRFVICRTRYPASISEQLKARINDVVCRIVNAFHLENTPMLVQMITDGKEASVVEFCTRTGGGEKYRLIKHVSNFDVIKAVVDLTLGEKPHVEPYQFSECIVNEFLYAEPGIFDHLEGFEELKQNGIIDEYYQLKCKGMKCGEIASSGNRIAYYTIHAPTMDAAKEKDRLANSRIRALDTTGRDLLRHDLIADY